VPKGEDDGVMITKLAQLMT